MDMRKPKIGYFCSYVPWELLSACGWEGVFLSPSGHPSRETEALFPVSFCPSSKVIGETVRSGELDTYLGALSCDASCRTWEVMKACIPQKTVLSLEVPFGESAQGVQRFSEELRRVGKTLAQEKGVHLW
ncbi:MAG: 2-hydroxyacyl-CoA dehydratase, partial [Candidatus Caldatribacteriaceae bacterium]